MMTIRDYKRAESLEEAWQLNQKKQNRILGGMIWLKMETINVGTAIDLSGLGLDIIEETPEKFSIGAMVTLRQLEEHPGLAAYTQGAVREALRHIVGVQLRNLATVGGSLLLPVGAEQPDRHPGADLRRRPAGRRQLSVCRGCTAPACRAVPAACRPGR